MTVYGSRFYALYLEHPGYATVKPSSLPPLRCSYTNPSSISELVSLVEQVHDIESNLDLILVTQMKIMLKPDVHRVIARQVLSAGKAVPKSASIQYVGVNGRIVKLVRSAR
jgi:hypothetical protein